MTYSNTPLNGQDSLLEKRVFSEVTVTYMENRANTVILKNKLQ